ncbi:YrhC family protein [Tuberibacillus sp. Marseille-P3662]|uniref:YrhC family protein n=1 Tax=Tuberibacillus sp. Marseille-P3662 TaxID=1965358 RepID=UPI000A1CDEA1|nr:YrhC family protein [Tuberibacillus sp. Marseille-P3662]
MSDNQLHQLKNKMTDYQRFSLIFLFLSAFIFVGSVIPFAGRTALKADVLALISMGCVTIALLFYWRMRKAKEAYENG